MIETLTNLKNNKVKKNDTSSVEMVERMKKFLGTLGKRYHCALHCSYQTYVLTTRSIDRTSSSDFE